MLKSEHCVETLFNQLVEKMYMPSDQQLLCLDCIKPQIIHDMGWRYELRGYVKALVASGVTSSSTITWLEERLFGENFHHNLIINSDNRPNLY